MPRMTGPPSTGRGSQPLPTRTTRSASREPDPAPPQKGRGAAAKRGVSKANTAADTGDDQNVDLTTINEAADLEEQPQDNLAAMEDVPSLEPDDNRAASVFSGYSAATAKTSFSQEEIGELDPDIMVDVLSTLSSAADELAKLLVPTDPKAWPAVRKEIRTPGSKFNKLYNNRMGAIRVHKDGFGSTKYIQPSIVLRALLRVESMQDVPQGSWRPDSILFKVNLSTMLRTILILANSPVMDQAEYDALEDLDVNFGGAIVGPIFSDDAFHFCVSLLRQLAIVRLTWYRPDPSFNPVQHILKIFYMEDEDGDRTFRHAKTLHMFGLPRENIDEYSHHLQNVVSEFIDVFDMQSPESWAASADDLQARYPWERFVNDTIAYYLRRRQELDQQIADVGGIEHIIASLAEEVERRSNARAAEVRRQSFARPGGTPRRSFSDKASLKALKARQKKLQGTADAALAVPPATAPVAQMTDPVLVEQAAPSTAPVEDDWQLMPGDDDAVPESESAQPAGQHSWIASLASFNASQQRPVSKGKGPSLLDRQPGAHRVAFDSQLTEYAAPPTFQYPTAPLDGQGPYYGSPGRASNKRTNAVIDEDEPDQFEPTQDQGFETMDYNTAAADERRRQAPQPTQRHSPNITSSAPGPSGTVDFLRTSPRPTKLPRRNPGASIPDPPAPYDPEDTQRIPQQSAYQQAKIQARHNTVRTTQSKPPQARNTWTAEEDNALIDLVMTECNDGISYASLKKLDQQRPEGPLLDRRSAEDIRFKARNMKVSFLGARLDLPQNFEYIVLDRKAIVKLQNQGINYAQEPIRRGNVEAFEG